MQNHKDIIKKKNELMTSIMKHPKLSKTFDEAFSAPIGSTKRGQARSVLSIMRKMGALQPMDGKGGMESGVTQTLNYNKPSPAPTKNYSNMVIFPAAPAFKKRVTAVPTPTRYIGNKNAPINDSRLPLNGKGGPIDTGTTTPSITPFDWGNGVSASFAKPTSTIPKVEKASPETLQTIKDQEGYQQGFIPKAFDWGYHEALPVVGKTAGIVGGTALGLGEMAARDIWATPGKVGTFLFGGKPSAPYAGLSDTWGGRVASDLMSDYTSTGSAANIYPGAVPATGKIAEIEAKFGPAKWGDQSPVYTKPTGAAAAIPATTLATAPTDEAGVKQLQDALVAQGWMTEAQKQTGYGTYGPQTKAAVAAYQASLNKPTGAGTGPGTTTTTTTTTDPYAGLGLPSSVNYPGGAAGYALDAVEKRYPGGLAGYMASIQSKADAQLGPLEQELTRLKSQSQNLIPTLTNYVKGKDQYMKFIDGLIKEHENALATTDMADPTVAASYNNYKNYLYTLKGRQTQRYQNFLTSAKADYEAEVSRATDNYNQVANRLQTAISQEAAIAQEDYNNLYTRAAAVYTELENAPTKALNLAILGQQYKAAVATNLSNGISGVGSLQNSKYWADVDAYTKQMAIDAGASDPTTGTLDFTRIPVDGLIGMYTQNVVQGGDERAMTEAIRRVIVKTLEADPSKATTIKKMVTDLSNTPESAIFGQELQRQLYPSAASALETTLVSKMPEVKSAVNDLLNPYGGHLWGLIGQKKAGLADKTAWYEAHASLGKELLDSLYAAIEANIKADTAYANNPTQLYNQIFSTGKDADAAKILAGIMTVSS